MPHLLGNPEPFVPEDPALYERAQFRPGPPPPLSSALYARDYNETKTLGGVTSTAGKQIAAYLVENTLTPVR